MIETNPAVATASDVLRALFRSHPDKGERYLKNASYHAEVELLRHALAAAVDAHIEAGIDPETTVTIIENIAHHMIVGHDRPPTPTDPPHYDHTTVVQALADKAQP